MSLLKPIRSLSPLRIAIAYLVFGIIWIPVTDAALAALTGSAYAPAPGALFKGWVFVLFSALLIYLLSTAHGKQIRSTQARLSASNQQLQVLHRVFRHNVRNTLNVIEGHARELHEHTGSGQTEKRSAIIHTQSESLVSICEKLKLIEDVDPSTADNSTDLVSIVEANVARVRHTRPEIEIETSFPESAWIVGDKVIHRAVGEVLDNAIEHGDAAENGMTVKIEPSSIGFQVIVADSGPGIPAEEIEPILAGKETALTHASSIGLWLVKWICERHGGSLSFGDSEEGTEIILEFPTDTESRVVGMTQQVSAEANVPRLLED